MISLEGIIWYLVLIDSVIANVLAWCCAGWFKKNYKGFWKHFPLTRG